MFQSRFLKPPDAEDSRCFTDTYHELWSSPKLCLAIARDNIWVTKYGTLEQGIVWVNNPLL